MNTFAGPRARRSVPVVALAAICYIPLLLTHRGQVGADTKSYLTIDPGRLLDRAWSMWDPNIGLGSVTHQNIGYLWPMGPWFWAFERLGAPDWVAQRLWLGSILFLAGVGVRFLMHTLGQRGSHVTASMFIYGLTPYVLTLEARISVLLLAYTALPWMIGLTIRAGRDGGWLYPGLFALLIPTIGSTNATALILVGLGPALWLPFAVFVLGEITIRQAIGVMVRIAVLTVATSLWWIAGLYCQGAFGIDVLQYSETARTVADGATAPELLRGLGYWFFYGGDKVGPWIEPSVPYTQTLALIFATYLLACIGLFAAGFTRWRYRAYFAGLVIVGLVAAVGAHPWDDPPVWGKGVRAFLLSDAGLAMRSLPRAVPLIALGLSVLTGVGVASLGAWMKRVERPLAAGIVVLAVLCLPPLWTGDMVASNLQRPEELPEYWTNAARYLDSQSRDGTGWSTRVLEVPGSDFASYRWGNTVDPVTPGLMDRPYAARELIPYGTPSSADLMVAFDRQLQEGLLDPGAIAPIARLMGVGDIVLRGDLQYERYNLARPRQVYALLTSARGLQRPTGFGGDAPNVPDPKLPLDDELEMGAAPTLANPDKVEVFPVDDAQSIVRTASANTPVVLAGDGEGLVDAAASGLLDGRELVIYSASLAGDPTALRREVNRPGAALVLTDTNRRAGKRWSTVRENDGATEEPGEEALRFDPTDNRLPLFPDAGDDARTVVDEQGGVHVQATAYGNPITFTGEDRPANAVDDDPRTAWQVGAFSPVAHERIQLRYDRPVTTDELTLQHSDNGVQNRWITKVRVRFDGGDPVDLDVGAAAHAAPGQTIKIPRRTFTTLSIEVLADSVGKRDRYDGLSPVGFANIALGGVDVRADEVIRLPEDLLTAAGSGSARHPLSIVLTRVRTDPTSPLRSDEELSLARTFTLPTARRFTIDGQARVSSRAPDLVLDRLLGITAADGSPIRSTSSRRLAGDLTARAVDAIDGNAATAWSPAFDTKGEDSVSYDLAKPISFDHLDLRVVNDGHHSVPTRIRIEADGKTAATVDVPAVRDQATKDATTTVPLRFKAVKGRHLSFVVEAVRPVMTNDWVSRLPVQMPVGLAELGVPGLRATVPTGTFDTGCRRDLLTVDDKAVPVRVTGTVADALARKPLAVTSCGPARTLAEGEHLVRSAVGRDDGIDLDQLLLASPAEAASSAPPTPTATATVTRQDRDDFTVRVGARTTPTWLVLGQSHSLGWKASLDGKDLGEPTMVDGYANGWLLPAGASAATVELTWAPQRVVWGALVTSGIAVLACLALVAFGIVRRRRPRAEPVATSGDQPAAFRPAVLWQSSGAPPTRRATALAVVLAGGASAAVIGPIAGVAVAVVTVVVLRRRGARALTVLGPAALLAASGLFTIASQARHHLPPGFEWPSYFTEVHQVAYTGVALLALDLVVDRLWTGRWWSRPDAEHATADTAS